MWRGSWLWKEDGCRKDYTTLIGRTTRSVEDLTKKKARKKHGLHLCPSCREVRNQIPEQLGKREQRDKTSKDNWKWQKGITAHPLSEQSEAKPPDCAQVGIRKASMLVAGFRDHVRCRWFSTGSSGQVARADVQWCSLITTRRWDQCMGCTERWMPS